MMNRMVKRWINPGVIGMPANDGTERVWFLTMDCNEDAKFIINSTIFITTIIKHLN
jgi:hypothetical protein